jgi:hypothetical protein
MFSFLVNANILRYTLLLLQGTIVTCYPEDNQMNKH